MIAGRLLSEKTTTGLPQTMETEPRPPGLPNPKRFLGYISAYKQVVAQGTSASVSHDLTGDEPLGSPVVHSCHSEGPAHRKEGC